MFVHILCNLISVLFCCGGGQLSWLLTVSIRTCDTYHMLNGHTVMRPHDRDDETIIALYTTVMCNQLKCIEYVH